MALQLNGTLSFQTAATKEDLKTMKLTEITTSEAVERVRR